MSEEAEKKSLTPHIILAVVVVVIVILSYVLLADKEPTPVEPVSVPVIVDTLPEPSAPEVVEEDVTEYATEDLDQGLPEPVLSIEPPVEAAPESEPLDTSDATVKTSLVTLAAYEVAAKLLVNEDLLQRFVVLTANTANQTSAPNFQVVTPPEAPFKVYQQSGRTFVDATSFQRYRPYVDVFEAMDTDALLSLYDKYKPALDDIYAEIGEPDSNFKFVLLDAINHVLDTPEVPVPIEVYTDSVMYKFKDERLESLSLPQKQMLRTGPENMRRIKAKLRVLKSALL